MGMKYLGSASSRSKGSFSVLDAEQNAPGARLIGRMREKKQVDMHGVNRTAPTPRSSPRERLRKATSWYARLRECLCSGKCRCRGGFGQLCSRRPATRARKDK